MNYIRSARVVAVCVWVMLFIATSEAKRVGILYEGWHAYAVHAMNEVKALGHQPLTVDDVFSSGGTLQLSDIYNKYGLAQNASNFYYQSTPQAGYYCIFRRRAGDPDYGVPDCANITGTLTRHAKQLSSVGIDYVAADGTNIPSSSPQGDIIQLRPLEVLFEEWHNLRLQGITTPQIAMWQTLPTGGTYWQQILPIYNNASYADLVMKDVKTGKKVMFTTMNPDPNLVAQVESNGGRNDVIVQVMWAELSQQQVQSGLWTFFSPCMQNGVMGTTVAQFPCNQALTQNSKLGTQLSVSPSYQWGYGSLPFQAPGKLSGLTFKKQFANAFALQPDYLFISSWNEWIAQPQSNPYTGKINNAFSMGLPNDPMGVSLWVDSYLSEFSRDIEPTAKYGSYIYDVMASCLRIYLKGVTTCNNPQEICCQSSEFYSHVWSLQTVPAVAQQDNLVTISQYEAQTLIQKGTYTEICNAYPGPTIFCVNTGLAQAQSGPFMLYNQNLYGNLRALYRCVIGLASHFISTDPKCEGQKTESQLGWISPTRTDEMPRALYRCYAHSIGRHYHSLDVACPPQDQDYGLLGYAR